MKPIGSTLKEILPPSFRARALEVFERQSADWERIKEKFGKSLPNVALDVQDLLWNADVIGHIRELAERCGDCDTSTWTRGETGHNCKLPLVPAVTRGAPQPANCPVGRLTVKWLPCSIYLEWAKRGTEEPQTHEQPRRTWKRRRAA